MLKFALAGNPNSGKTTLFNNLTGSTAHVGNWPGVTVDKREGTYKKCGEPVKLVDLPGIYSLSPYTPEEIISRNFILEEKPDCIINIVDATNLERNLYLTTQLMEIDVPVIVVLNMMDLVKRNGDQIDVEKLENALGVPVVAVSALKRKGLKDSIAKAIETSKTPRNGKTVLTNSCIEKLILDLQADIIDKNEQNSLFHSIKFVENDEIEIGKNNNQKMLSKVDEFKSNFKNDIFGDDLECLIADARYRYITANYSNCLHRNENNKNKLAKAFKADKILTNKWLGIPIFFFILFLVFHFTFSENFLFLKNALKGSIAFEGNSCWEGLFLNGEGIDSLGVILQKIMIGFTSEIGGLLEKILTQAPVWLQGLVVNGVWEGVAAVLSFVPQILLLFLFFSILEDSGYMARVAFILDRVLRKFGLSGRAIMPMIMGFGCSVPAMINTRTLADENEKIATIRVIPFFSCGAKLPILTAIAGALCTMFHAKSADLITYGMYSVGIAIAIISVYFMRKTTLKGETPPFIMELPAYHLPQIKSLMVHLWDKLKHFLKKAFTIIFASTIVIWFVSHFTFDWKYLEDTQINQSILAGIGQLITPIFTPLGFGSQLKAFSWVFIVAAITGLIAKENVIATFAVLAAFIANGISNPNIATEIGSVEAMIQATGITVPALIAFIVFNMTTIPCLAAVATAKAELPKKKFLSTVLMWFMTSYIAGAVIYLIGTWWWTCFIFIALLGLAVFGVWLLNKIAKSKKSKEVVL